MKDSIASKRRIGLDFIKYICSFMIVCIHAEYFGKSYFEPVTRFAVPVFFMVTGYFYSSVVSHGRELAQIKKIIRLFIYTSILYFTWTILVLLADGLSLSDYFQSFKNPWLWFIFIFLNGSFLSEHLWYIHALLYVLIIIYFFDRRSCRKRLYKLIPFLLLGNVVLGNYSIALFGQSFLLVCSRNFLFFGLPFFLLGDYFRHSGTGAGNRSLLMVLILSVITSELENILLLKSGALYVSDCFISTPFMACSLFLLIIKNEGHLSRCFFTSVASIGKKTATTIYVIHPIVIYYLDKFVDAVSKYTPVAQIVHLCSAPFTVFFISTLVALLLNKLKKPVS